MRTLLILWLTPSALFWSWHFLSENDLLFAKSFHDQIFELYGKMLGIAPDSVPTLFARAVFTDSLLIAAILAFRHRRAILTAVRSLSKRPADVNRLHASGDPAHPAG